MFVKPHEATASWTGYVYQGHVATYYALRKINQLLSEKNPDEELKKYKLEIEWMEDFAIIYTDELKSVHQVKCYNHGQMSKYEGAILDLLLKLIKYKNIKSYLHVSNNITWWNHDKIYGIFCKGIDEIGKKFSEFIILNEEDQLKKMTGNKSKLSIEGAIYNQVESYKNEGREEPIKLALENLKEHLEKDINIYKDKAKFGEIFKKIELYKYNGECYINELDIKSKIKDELKIFYKDNEEKLNDTSFKYVFLNLCGKINEHIYARNNSQVCKYISFEDIIRLLNSDLQRPDDSYYIYNAQQVIQQLFQEYCNNRSCEAEDKECINCNLLELINSLKFLTLKEFDVFLSNVRADKIGLDDRIIMTLFGGIEDSLFDIIQGINKFKLDDLKVLSNRKEDIYLALICNDDGEKKSNKYKLVKNIIKNPILFKNLYNVNKIVTERICIDSIKDFNPDINDVPNINEKIDNKEIARKINEIKDLKIISKQEAKGELNYD